LPTAEPMGVVLDHAIIKKQRTWLEIKEEIQMKKMKNQVACLSFFELFPNYHFLTDNSV
jgi:hypothetical protein